MAGKINFLGHPVHPMVIAYPLAFLTAAVVLDIVYLVTGNSLLALLSYWSIAVGVLGGLFAAIFGVADWLGLENRTRAKRIGLWHGLINVVTIALFAVSWFVRRSTPDAPNLFAVILGFVGFAIAGVGAWLGGELVYRLSVGVDEGAHVNSPSSLSNKSAKETAR